MWPLAFLEYARGFGLLSFDRGVDNWYVELDLDKSVTCHDKTYVWHTAMV